MFLQYFLSIFGIYIKCRMLRKKMMVIGQIFLKFLTPKVVLISMHNRDCFRKRFGSEPVNESQKLLKSAEKYFYPIFSSFWAKSNLENLFLIRSQILGLLFNTLTATYQYSRSNRENLPLNIQIKLSKKRKLFAVFSFNF